MPRTERLAAEPRWARSRLRRVRRSTAAVRAMLLIPLAVMLVAFAVFLGMSTSRPPCPPANGPHALVAGQSHPTNCQQVTGSKGFGHGP